MGKYNIRLAVDMLKNPKVPVHALLSYCPKGDTHKLHYWNSIFCIDKKGVDNTYMYVYRLSFQCLSGLKIQESMKIRTDLVF